MLVRPDLFKRASARAAALAAVLLATVFLPFYFPVTKSVSLSYVVDFNNHASFLIFVASAFLFAGCTRFLYGAADAQAVDTSLGYPTLLIALACTAVAVLSVFFATSPHIAQGEALYNINRLQMFVTGHTPYVQFEYAYGPLHLYLARTFSWFLHVSAFNAYYVVWALEWLLGVVIFWLTVRWLQGSLRHRTLVFCCLLCLELPEVFTEGVSYTALRYVSSAFLLVWLHRLWVQQGKELLAWCCSVVAISVAFSISAEQGVAVAGALIIWLFLVAFTKRSHFGASYAAALLAFVIALFYLAYSNKYFTTAFDFGQGAFAFPLTLGIPTALILITYAFAFCALAERLAFRDFSSQTVLLTIGGIFLLPMALGRADIGHLDAATPLLLVGIAYVDSHAAIRQPWRTACILVFVLPSLFSLGTNVPLLARYSLQNRHPAVAAGPRRQAATNAGPELVTLDGGTYLHSDAPCATKFAVIDLRPSPRETAAQNCLDTGYYDAMTNLLTTRAITRQILTLQQQSPKLPLLLRDGVTLKQEFALRENNPLVVIPLEQSWYFPNAHHPAEDYAALIGYITENYVPAPTGSGGVRVWRPKQP